MKDHIRRNHSSCGFLVLLAITFTLTPAPGGAFAKYSGGTGEPNDPYQIATRADLLALGADANDYSKSFSLTADIDLDPCLPGGQVFTAAIFRAAAFQGQFDGSNHKIANFSISGYDGLGLFLWITQQASVKDVVMENCLIQCNFSVSGGKRIGALAGTNEGTITNCSATGVINGNLYTGGLVGWNQGNITNCRTNTLVTTAGVVTDGHTNPGSTGGLVGVNFRSSGHANIMNCFSSGTVTGTANSGAMGGLVGYNDLGGDITNCYSTAIVTGGPYIGGLVGTHASFYHIVNCYSTGPVSGTNMVGGLVGQALGTADNSFWDTQTSGQLTSAAGIGKTTAQMKTLSTFTSAGWDFANTWGIGTGQTYPYLKPFNDINPADMNYDGKVDMLDFAVIAANWLSEQ